MDLALNNLQRLICHKIQPNDQQKITSIKAILLTSQISWTGHDFRIKNYCLLRIILSGKLFASHCNRRVPKKQFKDYLKKSFGACHMNHL